MSIKAKIKSIEPAEIVGTGERYLDVAIEIQDGKETIERKLGYPIGTTEKEIKADIEKYLTTHQLEKAQKVNTAEADAENTHVAKLQDSLTGEEVAGPEVDEAVAKNTKGLKTNARSKNATKKGK